MEFKQFTKTEIDKNFKRSYDKLTADLDYLEDLLVNDESDLKMIKNMKIELKSLKFYRN